ncbi:MAG: hypothetical protein IT291_07550 [Deltaproteobacteria bacterium]|nr:hypothetical protein [Deltaproteobacteria bacterium]
MASGPGPFEVQKPDIYKHLSQDAEACNGSCQKADVNSPSLRSEKRLDITKQKPPQAPLQLQSRRALVKRARENCRITDSTLEIISDITRRFECPHYETCLSLAAALDWPSFTCRNCCGDTNKKLMWRAHQETRQDDDLATLCELPPLSISDTEVEKSCNAKHSNRAIRAIK